MTALHLQFVEIQLKFSPPYTSLFQIASECHAVKLCDCNIVCKPRKSDSSPIKMYSNQFHTQVNPLGLSISFFFFLRVITLNFSG